MDSLILSRLGVEHFGQSGDTLDLYHAYRIDAEAILDAVAMAIVEEWKPASKNLSPQNSGSSPSKA